MVKLSTGERYASTNAAGSSRQKKNGIRAVADHRHGRPAVNRAEGERGEDVTDELYEILTAPDRLQRKVDKKKQEVEEIESRVYPAGIRYDRDKVQTSPRDDQIPEIVAETEPLIRELEKLQKEYGNAVCVRNQLLGTLKPLTEDVVTRRFFEKRKWEDMTRIFHYSRSTLIRIYRKGIQDMENTRLMMHFGLKIVKK